jgi:predicted RNA-binding protein with PIN domain
LYYLIDGYNFLFSLLESKQSLASQRENIILFIKKQFALLNLNGELIFDGDRRRDEESGISYASPLQIVYSPKEQTADEYILEKLHLDKKKSHFTVVTNDRGLTANCRPFKVKILSNQDFLKWLQKKQDTRKKTTKTPVTETKQNIERLRQIFEKKLKEDN